MKKNIIITGASGSLGSSLISFFKKKKYNIIAISRKKNNLIKDSSIYYCDLSDEEMTSNTFRKIKKKYNKIDSIIACAGNSKKTFKNIESKKDWISSFNDNFYSFVNVIKFFLKYFKIGPTNIIAISSIVDKNIIDAPIPYSISKSALTYYCKIKSYDLAKKNIKINVISPGNILKKNNNWDLKIKQNKKKIEGYINKNVPLKSFCNTDDIAEICSFLIEKNRKITGSRFVIDAGQSRSL